MTFVVIFFIVQVLAAGYALWRGGAPERLVAAMEMTAATATAFVPWSFLTSFHSLNRGILWIDVILFIGLLSVALFADRFWPMWLASLQLLALATHGVRAYDSQVWALAYWLITGKLAYPMMIGLIVGTMRHTHRLRSGIPDYDWTHVRLARAKGRKASDAGT